MKFLFDGRCSHHIKEAASCRLSAARNEYLSKDCFAKSRTWSLGRTSLQPRSSNARRATAPCLSRSDICLSRWRRQIALQTSTRLPTKLRARIPSGVTEPDGSQLRERAAGRARWRPRTPLISSQLFVSVGHNCLNRLILRHPARRNLQKLLNVKPRLREAQLSRRNQLEFLAVGTFRRERNKLRHGTYRSS